MSVTESGPGGYEYQYIGTVFFVLLLMQSKKVDGAFVEKLNSEDLSIRLLSNDRIEFQFKLKQNGFQLDHLARCCLNFNPRSSDINVFSKLCSGEVTELYIVTSARVEDSVNKLGVLTDIDFKQTSSNVKEKDLNVFLDSLENTYSSESKSLGIKRDSFVKIQIQDIRIKKTLGSIISKVKIIESVNKNYFNNKSSELLRLLKIPSDNHDQIISKLELAVRENRTNNRNIVELFNDIIDDFKISSLNTSNDYIHRNEEDRLFEDIKSNKIILITGESFCGKTQVGLKIGKLFCKDQHGTRNHITSSILEAQQFLLSSSQEKRLCILEDPFGQGDKNSNITYEKFEEFLAHVRSKSGKYLIVTANISSLAKVSNNHIIASDWINLTVSDRKFLKKVWGNLNTENSSELLYNKVINLIEKFEDPKELQPGNLKNIARFGSTLKVINEDTIKSLAFKNAGTISDKIYSMGSETSYFMALFSIISSVRSGPTMEDLIYYFWEDDSYFPGIVQKLKKSSKSILELEDDIPEFPEYKSKGELPLEYHSALQDLLLKDFLVEQNGEFKFSHPLFELGGKQVLLKYYNSSLRRPSIYNKIKKGIGSLSAIVSQNSIMTVSLLVSNSNDNFETIKLLEIAEWAIKSTFVNVRFEAFQFLILNSTVPNKEKQQFIIDLIRDGFVDKEEIVWRRNSPYCPDFSKKLNGVGMYNRLRRQEKGEELWMAILSSDRLMVPEEVALVVDYLYKNSRGVKARINLDIEMLLPFARYKEFFIVEKAAYLWSASLTDENFYQYNYALAEDRPHIKFWLLKGLMRAWPYFQDVKIKELIFHRLSEYLNDKYVAILALDFFTQFGAGHTNFTFDWRDEIEEIAKKEMWNLWARLAVKVFNNLPPIIHIHNARFSSTLMENHVTDLKAIEGLAFAFLNWLKVHFETKNDKVFDTHNSYSILSFLELNLPKLKEEKCIELLTSLFQLDNILFIERLIISVIYRWDMYGDSVHQYLLHYFRDFSPHQKALILTTENCPAELFLEWLKFDLNEFELDQIFVKEFPTFNLLERCIAINYFYRPKLDLDDSNNAIWQRFAIHCIIDSSLNLQLYGAYVYFRSLFIYRNDSDWPAPKILLIAYNRLPVEQRLFVFRLLVYFLNYDPTIGKETLKYFIKDLDEDFSLMLLDETFKISEFINKYDNFELFPNDFRERVNRKFSTEILLFSLMKSRLVNDEVELCLNEIIQNNELKLDHIVSDFVSYLNQRSIYPKISEKLELIIENIRDNSSNQKKSIDLEIYGLFSQWIPDHCKAYLSEDLN
ncbi:hypothetical protein [Sphingobacterium sp. BIGb0116]|uniref:nSTAND3 domain-containing NTPase n=1 Tax=Sphingobacterium sp. BIGb0116 TaxID=2940619 RepID=UPI00216A491C|nr:hypothetical protein [Sphingobacterium sp. BIGb0116]MCS4165159.1 hypothetical protein [Sphingobacterium sp. BIGb0116]